MLFAARRLAGTADDPRALPLIGEFRIMLKIVKLGIFARLLLSHRFASLAVASLYPQPQPVRSRLREYARAFGSMLDASRDRVEVRR